MKDTNQDARIHGDPDQRWPGQICWMYVLTTLLEKSLIPIGIIGYFFAPWHSACLLPEYKPICTGKLKEIYPGNNLIGESFFTLQIPYQDINQL